jgi:hypothetical protein
MYSQRFNRDSRQGTNNSINGAPSEQDSYPPQASSRGGWGKPNGSFRPQASGGSGWGRPQHASETSNGGWGRSSFQRSSAAVGGGWGRPNSSSPAAAGGGVARQSSTPNFACVLIAALLLLPGVTQPIADEFTQNYIQRNHIVDPHTQDDIERALAEFNQQQQQQRQQKPPAPPEGYTVEYVSHCFCDKYDLPENLQASFDAVVSSYITKNPKSFTMKIETAVARALLHIHESLSKENGGSIPENANRDRKEISDVEKFHQNLRATLVSYDLAPEAYVDKFLADYFRKKPNELVLPLFDRETGKNQCLTHSSLYTPRHSNHAVFSFFTNIDIIECVTRKLHLSSKGQIPISFLPSDVKKLVAAATDGNCGLVPNAFLMFFPPDGLRPKFRELIDDSLITDSFQSKSLTIPLTSTESKQGVICIVMCNKIFSRTARDHATGPMFYKSGGHSQYNLSSRQFGIRLGISDKPLCWEQRGIPCTYSPANMKESMGKFCQILQEWGGVSLVVVNDTAQDFTPEESHESSAQESSSSAYTLPRVPVSESSNLWGAAAAP